MRRTSAVTAAAAAEFDPTKSASDLRLCSNCRASFGGKLGHACLGCLSAAYCGAVCQQAAWKGGHKVTCAAAGAARFAAMMESAEAGSEVAQLNAGICYEDGCGVAADAREAVKWYARAAEAGYAKAQFNLGCCYANGTSVVRDLAAARQWFTRAAAAGDAQAAGALAKMDALGRR